MDIAVLSVKFTGDTSAMSSAFDSAARDAAAFKSKVDPLTNITMGLDTSAFSTGLNNAQRESTAARNSIVADFTAIRAAAATPIDLNVGADTSGLATAQSEITGFKTTAAEDVNFNVGVDTSGAATQLTLFEADKMAAGSDVTANIGVDMGPSLAELAGFEVAKAVAGSDVTANVDVDAAAGTAELIGFTAISTAAQGAMGALSNAGNVQKTMFTAIAAAILLASSALTPLLGGLGAVAALGVGAAAGFGLVGAAAYVMVKGLYDGGAAFAALSASASAVGDQLVQALGPASLVVADVGQQALSVATQYIPMLGPAASGAAAAAQSGLQPLFAFLASQVGMNYFEQIFASATPIVGTLTQAAGALIQGLIAGLSTLAPYGVMLATAILGVANAFAQWATSASGQAQIIAAVESSIPVFQALWDMVVQVGGALLAFSTENASSVAPAIGMLTTILTGVIGAMSALFQVTGPVGVVFVALVPMIMAAIVVLGAVASAITTLIGVITPVITALGGLSVALLAIAAIGAIVIDIIINFPDMAAAFSKTYADAKAGGASTGSAFIQAMNAAIDQTVILGTVASIVDGAVGYLDTVSPSTSLWDVIKGEGEAGDNPLLASVQAAWEGITAYISGAAGTLATTASSWVTTAGTLIAAGWAAIQAGVAAAWAAISAAVMAAWAPIQAVITAGMAALTAAWTAGWTVISTVTTTLMAAIQMAITAAWTIIQTIITAGLAVLSAAWTAGWTVLVTIATTIWTLITTAITTGWALITTTFTTSMAILSALWTAGWALIQLAVTTAWTAINLVIATALEVIVALITGQWALIPAIFQGAWDAITAAATAFWASFTEIISTAWASISEAVNTGITGVTEALSTGWEAITTAVTTAWTTITTAISTAWTTITTTITEAITAVAATLDQWWQTISTAVSTVWAAILAQIVDWWAQITAAVTEAITLVSTTLDTWWATISTAVTTVWTAILAAIVDWWAQITTAVTDAITLVSTTLDEWWATIQDAAATAWETVTTTITDAWDLITTTVTDAVAAVGEAIQAGWDAIVEGVTAFGTALYDALYEAFWTAVEAAGGALAGLLQGIQDAIDSIGVDVGIDLNSAISAITTATTRHEDGGIHFAKGGMGTQASNARMHVWNEGMGGEAYIAQRGPRAANLRYLSQAARWFGAAVVPNPGAMENKHHSAFCAGGMVGHQHGGYVSSSCGCASKNMPVAAYQLGGTHYDYDAGIPEIIDQILGKCGNCAVPNTYSGHSYRAGCPEGSNVDYWGPGGRGDPIDFSCGECINNAALGLGPTYTIWNGILSDMGAYPEDPHYDHVHTAFCGGAGAGGIICRSLKAIIEAAVEAAKTAAHAAMGAIPGAPLITGVGDWAIDKPIDAIAKWVIDQVPSCAPGTGAGPSGGDCMGALPAAIKAAGLEGKGYENSMPGLINCESGGDPKAQNPSGASGCGQMMPPTFDAYKSSGCNDIFDPMCNLLASLAYQEAAYGGPVPGCPYLTGGVVPGMGQQMIMAHGGERVLTQAQNKTFEALVNNPATAGASGGNSVGGNQSIDNSQQNNVEVHVHVEGGVGMSQADQEATSQRIAEATGSKVVEIMQYVNRGTSSRKSTVSKGFR